MDKHSENSSEKKSKDSARAFGCPCGKTYLSYPALFTHVKQKHEGNPPGKLIKPKTGKIRGRPKTRVDLMDIELNNIMTKISEELPLLLQNQNIEYFQTFSKSQGNVTCRDVTTKFVQCFQQSPSSSSVLSCFANELKSCVNEKFGEGFWEAEKPDEIIQVANDLYKNHEQKQSEFPLSKNTLKQLIYYFFQWLFAQKFSNHRLVRIPDESKQNEEDVKIEVSEELENQRIFQQ